MCSVCLYLHLKICWQNLGWNPFSIDIIHYYFKYQQLSFIIPLGFNTILYIYFVTYISEPVIFVVDDLIKRALCRVDSEISGSYDPS